MYVDMYLYYNGVYTVHVLVTHVTCHFMLYLVGNVKIFR